MHITFGNSSILQVDLFQLTPSKTRNVLKRDDQKNKLNDESGTRPCTIVPNTNSYRQVSSMFFVVKVYTTFMAIQFHSVVYMDGRTYTEVRNCMYRMG